MNIYFGANKTLVKVIKEGAFGGIYFRNVSSGVNNKRYRKSCKEFEELKNIDWNYYCSNCCVVSVDIKCGASLSYWESKG